MTLQEVVNWLRYMEDLAHNVYSEAEKSGLASDGLSAFLMRLAEDEASHCELMRSAAELIREQDESPVSKVLVDAPTRLSVERPVQILRKKIEERSASEQDILEAIVTLESSEWNEIFLYVIDACLPMSPESQYIAATIQAHEKRIEEYIACAAPDVNLIDRMRSLPRIWENSLLVVDDDRQIRELLTHALDRYGQVTCAENGDAARKMIQQRFFNVMITDIDMPVLDGISLLRQTIHQNDHLRGHFILCTGNATTEVMTAAREYGVPLLQKPISIRILWDVVERVLTNTL